MYSCTRTYKCTHTHAYSHPHTHRNAHTDPPRHGCADEGGHTHTHETTPSDTQKNGNIDPQRHTKRHCVHKSTEECNKNACTGRPEQYFAPTDTPLHTHKCEVCTRDPSTRRTTNSWSQRSPNLCDAEKKRGEFSVSDKISSRFLSDGVRLKLPFSSWCSDC